MSTAAASPASPGSSSSPHDPQRQHHHNGRIPNKPHPLWPSLFAGAAQAILFNPVDRALYLRVHNREKHLFVWANWAHPFQGFANAAVYRTVSGATYLFFQDWFRYLLLLEASGEGDGASGGSVVVFRNNTYALQMGIGMLAGTANGWCLNWFQLVKYRLWSEGEGHFLRASHHIYEVGGARMFFRGAGVSVMRDVTFGVAYELLRAPGLDAPSDVQFLCNVGAGALASMLSSPFNYCRNIVYGSPTRGSPMRVPQLLQFLLKECSKADRPLRHLNSRLNLGWGTARVGVGIALGQWVFASVSRKMS